MQRPQRVNRADVQPDFIHTLIANECDQGRNNIFASSLDEEQLRVAAPQQIVVLQ